MYENSNFVLILIVNKTIRLIIGRDISSLRKNMQTTHYEIEIILKNNAMLLFPIKSVANII